MDISLSSFERDVLREIGNIGTGNATTSMAKLTNKRIQMNVPNVRIVSFDEMMEMIGGPEKLIVAMFFRIYGEISGSVYFMLSIEEAESLITSVTNGITIDLQQADEEQLKLGLSALKESANIITSSYLTALSDFMNVNMQPSIPYLSIDMAGALLSVGLLEVSQHSDHVIVINTELNDYKTEQKNFHGHFFFIPDLPSLPNIFHALGIESYE